MANNEEPDISKLDKQVWFAIAILTVILIVVSIVLYATDTSKLAGYILMSVVVYCACATISLGCDISKAKAQQDSSRKLHLERFVLRKLNEDFYENRVVPGFNSMIDLINKPDHDLLESERTLLGEFSDYLASKNIKS